MAADAWPLWALVVVCELRRGRTVGEAARIAGVRPHQVERLARLRPVYRAALRSARGTVEV